jgi:hypothetical protein
LSEFADSAGRPPLETIWKRLLRWLLRDEALCVTSGRAGSRLGRGLAWVTTGAQLIKNRA